MKKFEMPVIQVEKFLSEDVVTTSFVEPEPEKPTPGANGTPTLPF